MKSIILQCSVFLQVKLASCLHDIELLALFGSAVRIHSAPRDLDIVIVAAAMVTPDGWNQLLDLEAELKQQLFEGLPLHPLLLTSREWRDPAAVLCRIRNGPLYVIHGNALSG